MVMSNLFERLQSRLIAGRKIGLSDQLDFADRLSFLLNSDVPILEALKILENQTGDLRRKNFYRQIAGEIALGKSFSKSISPFVSNFFLGVVEAGQSGGFLGANLKYLSDELKRKKTMRKKVIQALVYPSFIALATLAIVSFLLVYIFPKILPVVRGLNMELPYSTRLLVAISGFISNFGFYFVLGVVVVVVVFVLAVRKNKKFRFSVHRLAWRLPILGKIHQDLLLANFCRSFGMLLGSGLPADRALKFSFSSANNLFIRAKLSEMEKAVARGATISTFLLAEHKIFPSQIGEMAAVGERTGNLSLVFINLGDFYSEQFSDRVKNISAVIEPGLLVLAGLIVGFVAVSIIAPVYEITHGLQKR